MEKNKKPVKPKLQSSELYVEIGKRTNAPPKLVELIIKGYQSVVYQCLVNQIAVPFGSMGSFNYKLIPPREHLEWNGWDEEGNGVVYYEDKVDGYVRPFFKFYRTFLHKIKQELLIPYGTMPSAEDIYELSPWSDIRIDYGEIRKQKNQSSDKEEIETDETAEEADEYDAYEFGDYE